jgi:hypothetical protein
MLPIPSVGSRFDAESQRFGRLPLGSGIERHRKLAELPYIVECLIPGGGLRGRLDAMQVWCREYCSSDGFVSSKRVDRAADGMPKDVLLIHFRDEAAARAFAETFGPSAARP